MGNTVPAIGPSGWFPQSGHRLKLDPYREEGRHPTSDDAAPFDANARPHITIGSAARWGFHAVAMGVHMRMLQRIGYDVTAIDWLEEPQLYPKFTGAHGTSIIIDALVPVDMPYPYANYF